ncbi:MAG: 4-vinyl reductase [Ardenticatenaceae bacterium]|nr:4-vinyl reductase [Ardenticatenaceae bacterium]
MDPIEGQNYFYPNRWARIILTSAEEIVGEKGVAALLNMAGLQQYIGNYPPENMEKEFSFTEIGKLQQAFWDMYGPRGARVFATRAGQQSLKDGLTSFGSVARAAQVAMKIGSMEKRIQTGLHFFAKFFNTVSDQVVRVDEDDEHWIWVIERCPLCTGRTSDKPVCHLAVGVLQGALAWASEGKQYRITPIECIACGDKESIIKIEKSAIE